MSQYKATDNSIFALGANGKGAVIQSKVPKNGFDEIRIARVGKDGKLVLKDKTGEALKAAFGDSTYRWDGKTPLSNLLQKYSFANRGFTGGQTDTGSKTTHRNITVIGAGDWQPVAQGAARGPNRASPAGKITGLQKQLAALQSQMDQLASPPKVAPKAKAKPASKPKTKTPPSATTKGKGKAKAPISFNVTAKDREELEGKLRLLLGQLEGDRKKKNKRPASSLASSPSSASGSAPSSASRKRKKPKTSPAARSPMAVAAAALEDGEIVESVPEPVVQDLTENQTYESFVAGKSVVAAHYTKVAEEMPDAKMTVKQLRQDLINHMYSETELRELADGADIQHGRISKLQTLRERLTEHFADMLPEADDA